MNIAKNILGEDPLTSFKEKKEEIRPSPMTKAPTPTEKSKSSGSIPRNACFACKT